MHSKLSVVILAAGQGKRMKSDLPKVLHTIGGKPLLAHVIAVAGQLGARQIIVVYGHGGEHVRDSIPDQAVLWIEQAEQLGTGHAVAQAMEVIPDEDDVLVLYGDVPLITATTLDRLVTMLSAKPVLGLLTARLDNPAGYGRILRNAADQVVGIVEQKDATPEQLAITEINTGMMAMPAGALRAWLGQLDNKNAQGEYYLTDVVAAAVAGNVTVNTVQPESLTEIEGINDKQQLAQLERAYQVRNAEELMQAGLTLRDPARFDIRGELEFGKDVVIDVNVIIEGQVRLGNGVSVGPNTILKNVSIGDGSRVEANSIIEDSQVGSQCVIGPFARIRPETLLADEVRIGNFVEVKKSSIDKGSKVNHLSYVGDTSMGADVNVGAGTITCNYDGVNKHRTIIGNGVFIGSDTQLVAPVTVGDGATIGAGSTITREVPADALALSRIKQDIKKDWKRPVKKQDKG